jgi:hypothetical protein
MEFVLGNDTSDATVTTLYLDNQTATQEMTLPANSAWTFHALIVGQQTNGSNAGGYKLSGTVRRDGAGSATAVGSVAKQSYEDVGAWDANATVSGNNLRITVTGAAATNINWTASVRVAQVIVES